MRDRQAKQRLILRIQRVARGNFGDHKSLGDGLWELRLNYGPGYRVYYTRHGDEVVLLLCGGTKRRQDDDIALAKALVREIENEN